MLLAYISDRSSKLNRLQEEAKRRADAATAIAELLHVLESSIQSVQERLTKARQATPADKLTVDAIITPQTIGEASHEDLRKLELEIREALADRLSELRKTTLALLRRHFKARMRTWFRPQVEEDLQALLRRQFDLAADLLGPANASRDHARRVLGVVNRRRASAVADALRHLSGRSEAWEIGSCTHDIDVALRSFERTHDDAVTAFYTYIAAPASSDLLREHGFVGFDESGAQVIPTESIDALNSSSFSAIATSAESCKDRLRSLSDERDYDSGQSSEDGQPWMIEDADLGDEYGASVARRVESVCRTVFDEFVVDVAQRVDSVIEGTNEARSRLTEARRRVWLARATILGRSALVGLVALVLGWFAVPRLPSEHREVVLSVLSDRGFLVGAASTFLVLAVVYVLSGARNEGLRSALRPVLLERLRFSGARRHAGAALEEYLGEAHDRLVNAIDGMQLGVDEAVSGAVIEGIKHRSRSFRQAEQVLAELRNAARARRQLFDEYIGVVNERLEELPRELRDRATTIKSDAVEAHLSRIQEVTDRVSGVKAKVQRVAEIARRVLAD